MLRFNSRWLLYTMLNFHDFYRFKLYKSGTWNEGDVKPRTHFCNILTATKQLYEWSSPSVCPSASLSVTRLHYHHGFFRSHYHRQKWCPRKRSRSEVKGRCRRGQNPIKPFSDRNSSLNSHVAMKWYKEGLPHCFASSSVKFQGHTGQKNHRF